MQNFNKESFVIDWENDVNFISQLMKLEEEKFWNIKNWAKQYLIKQITKLPYAKLAALGNPGGDNIVWRNMQGGVYGVGSGQQVARSLENRSRAYSNLNNYGRRGR